MPAKKFTEATDILKNMTNYYLPADLQAVVQKTYYEVAQAELQETEDQRRIQEMELTEQWDAAVLLMDSQRFDLAISAFELLMGTDYEEQATIKIVEAATTWLPDRCGKRRHHSSSGQAKPKTLRKKRNFFLIPIEC
jgi:hypothetical protein